MKKKYLKTLLVGATVLSLAAANVLAQSETWGGYPVGEDNWVNTQNKWFGWMNTAHSPWLYNAAIGGWLWAEDPGAGAVGVWSYIRSSVPDENTAEPGSWQEAWDTRDQETIDAWYEANTGPGALGVTAGDMWQTGRVTVTQAWLNANQGDHVFQEGNRWVIYAVKTPSFDISVNNVTIRACFVEITGSVFGFRGSGNNTVIEYCEVTSDGTSPQNVKGMSNITDVTVRYNKAYGMAFTVWRVSHNTLVEYNYVHSGDPEIKHVCASVRGNNSYVRRNNFQTSQGSQALGIYSHDELAPPTGLNNVLVEENLINSKESHYGIMGGGEWNSKTQQATNVVVVNNVFGTKWNPCCGYTGSNYLWLGRAEPGEIEDARGNVWSGNRWLSSGNYARPVPTHSPTCPDDIYDDPGVGEDGDAHTEAADTLRELFAPYAAR